jgi:hypothetical protein
VQWLFSLVLAVAYTTHIRCLLTLLLLQRLPLPRKHASGGLGKEERQHSSPFRTLNAGLGNLRLEHSGV